MVFIGIILLEIALFSLALYFPGLLVGVSFFFLMLIISHSLVKIYFALLPKKEVVKKEVKGFVSIHVPTHNEPPEMVINTLNAIKQLEYSDYEVLVIDNNTKDEFVWKPVEQYCKNLGSNFKFYHVEGLKGYKAGALNYLNDKIDPRTQYVAIIDADYELSPTFITSALSYFTDEKIAFVQFPQSYKNVNASNQGLVLEYEHFFKMYLQSALWYNSVNITGTLTVLDVKILRALNGYNIYSITEDADLGLRFMLHGYKGVYIDSTLGKGLMPYDLDSYKKQKRRWARGNVQVLKNYKRDILLSNIDIKQKAAIILQLFAWLNFTLIPISILYITAIISLIFSKHITESLITSSVVASSSLGLYVVLTFVAFFLLFWKEHTFSSIVRAVGIHLGMNPIYSTALFIALFNKNNHFDRTNKHLLENIPYVFKSIFTELAFIVSSSILTILFLNYGYYVLGMSFLGITIVHLFVILVYQELRGTQRLSHNILRGYTEHYQLNK